MRLDFQILLKSPSPNVTGWIRPCRSHKMPLGAACAPRVWEPLVYIVVKLYAHWNKYLLNAKFSHREHCWWPTS